MPTLRAILLLFLGSGVGVFGATNAARQNLIIETADEGGVRWNLETGEVSFTNRVTVTDGEARVSGDLMRVNFETGEVSAEGNVTLEQRLQTWRGDRLRFNFKSGEMSSGSFRMGSPPLFAEGLGSAGSRSNNVYVVAEGLVTGDDYAKPGYSVRARTITFVPGEYVECENAVLYLEMFRCSGSRSTAQSQTATQSLDAHARVSQCAATCSPPTTVTGTKSCAARSISMNA
jgi:lipopolysaccharide assembly outer membrane protein LptD (OstA)